VETPPAATNGSKPPGTSGTKPPGGNEPPGNDDPGSVLGGISRRPDAAVPATTPPVSTPPVTTPPPPPTDTPPPPASSPDAAPEAPPPETTDAEQTLATGVQRTVEGHMGQVRRCWENIAKSSSDSNLPEGTIEIQFAVQPSGNPAQVQVVQNQTGSPALGDCVVALVQSWRFPGHDGDPVVFVWPFFFQASK
jgi:TonB family protein